MKIKITGVPDGNAPYWIREMWVGIEFTTFGRESPQGSDEPGTTRSSRDNLGGYRVRGDHAFLMLKDHNSHGYEWWATNVPEAFFGTLIFAADVCEVISEPFDDDDIPF